MWYGVIHALHMQTWLQALCHCYEAPLLSQLPCTDCIMLLALPSPVCTASLSLLCALNITALLPSPSYCCLWPMADTLHHACANDCANSIQLLHPSFLKTRKCRSHTYIYQLRTHNLAAAASHKTTVQYCLCVQNKVLSARMGMHHHLRPTLRPTFSALTYQLHSQ